MLRNKEADQIIKGRFGDHLRSMGMKWVAKADYLFHKREGGGDIFVVGLVNYTTVQKIRCTIGLRFDRVEEIREEVLGYRPFPWAATISTPIDYYAGTLLEWECASTAELETAIDEIAAEFLPKVAVHYERYRDPIAMLGQVEDRNGDQPFAVGDDVQVAIGVLILHWLYRREGFDQRVKAYRERFAKYVPEVMAPFETIVKWLRSHPEAKGQP